MDVSLLIRLIDQFSAPAKTIAGKLKAIGDTAKEMGSAFGQSVREGFSVDNVEKASANAEQALSKARARLLGAFGMAMTLGAPVVQAAQFDQSMRGLDKVLDVSGERLANLRKFALDTSAEVPIAARDLVDLMSEAAQGGVPQEELEAFSLYVAKAAVAFDMAGGEIGDRFAKLRNVYKLNQQGIEELGDATNHLSNNMAAKASELTDFTNRASAGAGQLKLTAVQAAAVGAAMIASGIVPETAARGFNALATRATVGGKKTEEAFKTLGINRKKWLKELDQDAPKAVMKIFDAMNKSPKGMEALVDLVGMDFSDDFSKLVNNPELLAKAFGYVADAQDYAGSATQEAAKQAEGAVKKWELLTNKLTRLSIVIGDMLLPIAVRAMEIMGDLIDKAVEFAEANPELAASIVQVAAGMLALSIASRLLAFAIAAVRLPLIGLASTFLKFDESGRNIATGWRIIAGAGSMLGGAFGIVRAAAVGIVGAISGISAPVLAVGLALMAAGFSVWKYWDRISSFASGFASAFSGIWDSVKSGAASAADWLADKLASFLNLPPGQVEAFKAAFKAAFDFSGLIDSAKQMLADLWASIGDFFSAEELTDGEKAEMYNAGRALGESIINGIKEFVAEWITPIQDLFKFALEIEWPEPPDWLRWLMDKGGSLLDQSGDALNKGGNVAAGYWEDAKKWASGMWGGDETAAVPTPANNNSSWSLGGYLSDLIGAGKGAGDDITQGGIAVREGGLAAAREIQNAAGAISAAASSLRSAASAGAGGGGVARAIVGARTGAMHGGTD